jgi:hypothetical protein
MLWQPLRHVGPRWATTTRGHSVDHAAGNAAVVANADVFAKGVLTIARPMRDGGASLREIAETLTQRRIKTARGSKWNAMTVKNILDRGLAG